MGLAVMAVQEALGDSAAMVATGRPTAGEPLQARSGRRGQRALEAQPVQTETTGS